MRLALSFILPLLAVLALIAYTTIPLFDAMMFKWSVRDLDQRARAIAITMQEALAATPSDERMRRLFDRAIREQGLYAIALCRDHIEARYKTWNWPSEIKCSAPDPATGRSIIAHLERGDLHVARYGDLLLLHEMSLVKQRSSDTRRYLFYLFAALGLVICAVTVLVARLSWRRFLVGVKSILQGVVAAKPVTRIEEPELRPLARDLRDLIRDIESDRRTRDEEQITWTPKTLKLVLTEELSGDEILIVSNREPYIHTLRAGKIEARFPASGLVTALEPVMRACSGTWIAHGSGNADKLVVDENDRVAVPPDNPSYRIRRVWLDKEEESGYYYGFSNEGLWPLCHMAYTRPVFRSSDWLQYQAVNRKFAEAVVQEARTEDPVVMVQDYHLALAPRLIRERLPKATIITFWHIPWPNPEAFGICPWREEILRGLLGSSIMGFHTRFHCNNFLATVDRFLESRIDHEAQTVSFSGKLTAIKSYPISIEWPNRFQKGEKPVAQSHREIRSRNNIGEGVNLGIGVDRLDYTKGILERFAAVERLFERWPDWVGQFSLIQIAAPSRSSIEPYKNFEHEVRAAAERINGRFERPGYQPIILKVEHHEPRDVFEYYRGCDVCMVTSLHDGMNLVAKEFVAARDDERGSLILSQFTGAARELQTALIVNPYDIDQCAEALHLALSMPPEEQRDRIRNMRGLLQEYNVYRWAGRMLMDAARIRQQTRLHDRLREMEPTL